MLKLQQHISAVGKHAGAKYARQFLQFLVTEPEKTEQECQPTVADYKNFQTSVPEPCAAQISRERQPHRWIEQSGLWVAHKAHAAIDGRVPLRNMSSLQRSKGKVIQGVMVILKIVGYVEPAGGRQVLEEKQISEDERECRDGPQAHSGFESNRLNWSCQRVGQVAKLIQSRQVNGVTWYFTRVR